MYMINKEMFTVKLLLINVYRKWFDWSSKLFAKYRLLHSYFLNLTLSVTQITRLLKPMAVFLDTTQNATPYSLHRCHRKYIWLNYHQVPRLSKLLLYGNLLSLESHLLMSAKNILYSFIFGNVTAEKMSILYQLNFYSSIFHGFSPCTCSNRYFRYFIIYLQ